MVELSRMTGILNAKYQHRLDHFNATSTEEIAHNAAY